MYEEVYLSNDADRESSYYCLFNNDFIREVSFCFIVGAEFDSLLDDSRLFYQTLAAYQQFCEFKFYLGTLYVFLYYLRMMKIVDEVFRDGVQFFIVQFQRYAVIRLVIISICFGVVLSVGIYLYFFSSVSRKILRFCSVIFFSVFR